MHQSVINLDSMSIARGRYKIEAVPIEKVIFSLLLCLHGAHIESQHLNLELI